MLIETSGSNGDHDDTKLSAFLEHTMSVGHVQDGTLTNDTAKMAVRSHAQRIFKHPKLKILHTIS